MKKEKKISELNKSRKWKLLYTVPRRAAHYGREIAREKVRYYVMLRNNLICIARQSWRRF